MAVTRSLPVDVIKALQDVATVNLWPSDTPPTQPELIHFAQDATALICLLTDSINGELLSALPHLKCVSTVSVGADHIDLQACREAGVAVGCTPGVLVDATADLTWALLLGAGRRIVEANQFVKDDNWHFENRWQLNMMLGIDLAGKTLGIVGLGEVGQAVAKRAQGFGMNVIGYNRSPKTLAQIEQVSLDQLLQRSDVISINVALTDDTRDLIDEQALSKTRPNVLIVNTARGGIVNEEAMLASLNSGHVGGYASDVWAKEPVDVNDPLFNHERVLGLPHIGSATHSTRIAMANRAIDNVRKFIVDGTVRFSALD